MKIKGKICLCPESIRWIAKHLKKSARGQFRKLIIFGSVKGLKGMPKSFKPTLKRHFSPKQLAAQRLFAKRARAGTLRRRRR